MWRCGRCNYDKWYFTFSLSESVRLHASKFFLASNYIQIYELDTMHNCRVMKMYSPEVSVEGKRRMLLMQDNH